MTHSIVVIGAGGFGRETLDVLEALAARTGIEYRTVVVDDSPRDLQLERLNARGANYFGTLSSWAATAEPNDEYIIAIGNPEIRQTVASQLKGRGKPAAPLIHPTATIGSMVELGAGTVVCAGAVISTNVKAGIHTHINPGAIVGHDCRLGDYVSVNPGAVISGDVRIGDDVLVGAGATVLQGITIAERATIGAAACVTKHVDAAKIVKGVPAR